MASLPIPRRYRSIVYIPSRSDGCQLEVCLSVPTTVSSTLPQAYTGVVIAHPYGPLGGSYNNNVVGALLQWFETYPLQATRNDDYIYPSSSTPTAKKRHSTGSTTKSSLDLDSSSTPTEEQTLSEANPNNNKSQVSLACVICAFNFRGCGKSKGRTSWFGEAEREDYQTMIDFLQSGGSPSSSFYPGEDVHRQAPKVYDESGNEITPPRLPFLSRFILSGFSYGGLIASTIPPPLRDPTVPDGPRLPTSYIFVSYPAGVAWFLTSGSHGSFAKRAKAILHETESSSSTSSSATKPTVEAYFITGTQDQFTSPKTLLSWLKANTGLNLPKPVVASEGTTSVTSWAQTQPDTSVHVDIVDNVDHFWLDREQELLNRLQAWWTSIHPN
ncbi:hypothetical protein BGZ59_008987 [Podila verticillata]|nr:hypothetical protein BGZ59_008987 [Podila verticillata]KFH68531.1 hypothetical protein MVEG_05345 [Podila verticillata NRRL 6337]